MAVDFNRFRRWIERRFDDVVVKGKEIRINSIFDLSDTNHHLWISPSGGKKRRKNGVFHCFKTDRKGSLVTLVQLIDHCDRDDAIAIIKGHATLRDLEQQLEEMLNQQETVKVEPPPSDLKLPSDTYLISEVKKWWREKAEEYLAKRKIPSEGLYLCIDGRYKGRIIIPYYDRKGKLIYWNGRSIWPQAKLRYQGPDKDLGVGKNDVVYIPGKWPTQGEILHVCEGEFNAISLKLSGLETAACGGKNMSDKQALMLSNYRICLCLDRDKAGKAGTSVMSNAVSMISVAHGTKEKLFYVRPPQGYKDWNEMYVALGDVMVYHYVKKNAKPIDFNAPSGMAADIFGFSGL